MQCFAKVSFDVLRTSMQLGYVVEGHRERVTCPNQDQWSVTKLLWMCCRTGGDVMTSNVQMMSVVVQGNKARRHCTEALVVLLWKLVPRPLLGTVTLGSQPIVPEGQRGQGGVSRTSGAISRHA
eukprot:5063690-Amphidinium_carterae.2